MKGFIKVDIGEHQKDMPSLILKTTEWGLMLSKVKALYETKDYKQTIEIGRQFLNKYQDIKEAPHAEVKSIINMAQDKLFNVVMSLHKKEDYESIISQGKDYIEEYRNVKESKWEEIEKLVREAEVFKLYKEMEEEFLSIMNLNKNESYEFIITRGKSYIENYRDVKNSKWTKIAGLVKEAEIRKRKVEEKREHARLREEEEKKRRPVVKKLCQKYELLGQATQMLKQLKEIDSFSGTVNLYERRQIATAIVYTNKEIEQLKKEYKKLGGGEFSQKKCSSLKEDDLSDYGECIGDGCEDD